MNLSEQIMNNLNSKKRLYEHATIGTTEDTYNVYIRISDFIERPHFIYSSMNENTFYTCICIDKAEYLYEDSSVQALNFKQRENLVKFLQEQDETEPKKTRWQILLIEWNRNNPKHKVETTLKMPNYMNL